MVKLIKQFFNVIGSKTVGTLASGLVIDSTQAGALIDGQGTAWCQFKYRLKQHFGGLGRTGDIHIE